MAEKYGKKCVLLTCPGTMSLDFSLLSLSIVSGFVFMYRGAGMVVGGVCGLHVVVLVVNRLWKWCGGGGGGGNTGRRRSLRKNLSGDGHVEERVVLRDTGGNTSNNETSINS